MTADPFAEALNAHVAGDLTEAERLYLQILDSDARHAPARSNLAIVWLQQGRAEDGVAGLRRSLDIDPAQPLALNNLGSALRGLGRADEAIDAFRRAVALDAGQVDARVNLATLLEFAGRLDEAAEAYAEAAAVHPQPAGLRHAQGLTLWRLGRTAEAVAALRQAVELEPGALGTLNDLGVVLEADGRLAEAMDAYDRVLAVQPDYAEALNNRGLALMQLDRLGEALDSYDAAVAFKPGYTLAWFNRGDALCALGRFEEALESLNRALAADPAYADAWVRRGDMLGYLRRIPEAQAAYARAAGLDPANPRARFHLAFPLLREGRYAEGLAIYEQRWIGPLRDAAVSLPRPQWRGDEPVDGKTLLLHSEQGHGDTLMMLRYAPLLARRGARVIVSVQPPIERLAAVVEGVEAVIPQGEPLPPYDLHIPMMSLPLAVGTGFDTIPGDAYLRAPDSERALWAGRLGPPGRPRIGLTWSGSAQQRDNRWRSMPLERLGPLFDLAADLYALQTEITDADRETLASAPIRDLSSELQSYADTAAAMEQMDLIVTVCTSAANLAGGLGRPALVMLGAVADWRWGVDSDRSPWFPSARLFRQQRIGDWDDVVGRVRAAAEAALAPAV